MRQCVLNENWPRRFPPLLLPSVRVELSHFDEEGVASLWGKLGLPSQSVFPTGNIPRGVGHAWYFPLLGLVTFVTSCAGSLLPLRSQKMISRHDQLRDWFEVQVFHNWNYWLRHKYYRQYYEYYYYHQLIEGYGWPTLFPSWWDDEHPRGGISHRHKITHNSQPIFTHMFRDQQIVVHLFGRNNYTSKSSREWCVYPQK